MASDFFYFLSTLPHLAMPAQPGEPWSGPAWDDFLAQCRKLLAASDAGRIALLEACPPDEYIANPETVGDRLPRLARDWYDWQIAMRNALAKRRAAKMGAATPAARHEPQVFPNDLKRLDALFEAGTPVERWWAWLQLQWRHLDELAAQCQFNLDALAAYALKVRLMESARRYDRQAGAAAFAGMVDALVAAAQSRRQSAAS